MPLMKVYDKTTGQWLVMDSKNADTVDGKHYSDIQSEITTKANTAETNAKNASIPKTEKGKANGVAKLNASGKVVDASGNEVEGKVKSVNGVEPDTSGNISITIPTKTSQLTNDNGFISSLPDASTSIKGVVRLVDNPMIDNPVTAPTSSALASVYNDVYSIKSGGLRVDNSKKWDGYQIQINGTDGPGIINFKTE
jgi:hypothetical protein